MVVPMNDLLRNPDRRIPRARRPAIASCPPPGTGRGLRLLLLALCVLALGGCPQAASPDQSRPPKAEKWFRRAQEELRVAEIDAAHDSAQQALDLAPADEAVRVLAAKVALARLEFAEVARLLRGLRTTEALALLGRAYWYDGKLDQAAEALQAVLADPDYVDPWAKAVSQLALQGAGRKPFAISGGLLAAVELPRVDPSAPLYVVPLEIDGDPALALVATATAEVVLDSATRRDPGWVELRFGKRLEVRDVPALTQDLSQISAQLGAPVKALLGVNLLRQLNVTIDFKGRQFVARSFSPPPPPVASRIDLFYLRGGGMIMGTQLGSDGRGRAALFIDSASPFPLALDQAGWQKVGVDASKLPPLGDDPTRKLTSGSVPLFRLGALELPAVPAIYGSPIERMERELNVDVDGVVGAGLLANFRVTFADGGRVMWVEQNTISALRPTTPSSAAAPPPSTLTLPTLGAGVGGNLLAPSSSSGPGTSTTPSLAPTTRLPSPGAPTD
jgi:hypothetical protein